MLTVNEIRFAVQEAQDAAYEAARDFESKHFPNNGWGPCGFAWVELFEYNGAKLKGNTKMGRALKAAGVKQDWQRVFQIWNPSKFPTQNVDTLEAGARAAAEVLRNYGFSAYAGSRLD